MKRVPDRQQLQAIVFSLLVILSPIVGLMAFSGTAQAAHSQKEPNDFRSEAEPVSGGQITSTELGTASSLTGNVNTDSRDYDEDWFSFSPPESEFVLNVESIPSNEGDIGIEVEDGGGTTVATSNTEADAVQKDYDNDGVTETVTQVSVTGADTSDTYYVKLFAHDDPKNDPNVYAAEACGLNSDGDSSCDGNYELYLSYPPTADATTGDADGNVLEGQTVSFDASGTTDPDDSLSSLSFSWAFGDGSGSGVSPGHSFTTGNNGGTTSYTPEVTVTDPGGGQDTDTTKRITVYNDFDGDGLADVDNPSPSDIDGDTDDDNDGITDANDPAPYNVYPSVSDSSSESTDEDSTLTVSNGDGADLTELAIDGYESYDPNTDPISIEQIDGGSFSAGSTVTLDSGATVTVESDGGWTYDPNGTYENLAAGDTATDEFTYTVSDDQHSGTAAATEQGTVSVTINGVNDAPAAPTDDDNATNELAEDDTAGTAVGITASSTDIDDGDTVQYSLTADANGGFEIDSSTGDVTVADSSKIDYEVANNHTITVEASDGTAAVTEDFTITVTDVDETPTFTSATSNSVAENKTSGATVHDVDADVDADGTRASDTGVTYAITSGNVDNAFAIDSATGQVTVDNASAVETELHAGPSISFTVEAAEGQQAQTQTVMVDITQADEVPAFTSGTSASVSENAFSDFLVQDVQANVEGDPDEDVTYAITGGNSAGLFKIDSASGELTVDDYTALDHEDVVSVTLTIEASENTASAIQEVTVDVTDVDETPNIFAKSSPAVAEDAPSDTQLHDVDATVDDADSTVDVGVTYALVGGNADDAFAIDSATGELAVDNASGVETEISSERTITVEAAEGSESDTQDITVDISQADEVPVFTSSTTAAVSEDATDGTAVDDVEADVGGVADEDVSYAITSGNGDNAYAIDGSSGQITLNNAAKLDHEVSETRTVTVEASEGGATNTQNLSIDVTDAEETPSFSSDTTATVAESDTSGTDVLDVNATVGGDDDEGVGYAITAGNDDVAGNGGEPFTIDSSGQISISDTADIDESQQSSFSLTVEASEGAATNTQTVTVTVTDDVAPTFQPDSSTPADSATDHPPSEDLILRFDEGVTLTSGSVELVDDGDGSSSEMLAVSSGSVTVSGRTVTISPSSPLELETNYHVEIDGTAIEDAFGNSYGGFSDSTIYNFTTANTEPSFTSSGPVSVSADEDGSVDLTGVLEVRDVSGSDNLTWTVTSAPSNGGLAGVDNETQSISGSSSPHVLSTSPTYAPSADFHSGGSPGDSFTVQVTDTSPGTSDTITVDVTVNPVNDRPTISLPTNPNQTIGDDTTAQTVADFIDTSTFDPGPNETSQALSDFLVDNDNNGLFATQPDITTDGNLTYTPADNATGTATVDVRVRDDAGTTNGGDGTSTARSFTITVGDTTPSIAEFSASNPSGQVVSLSFESDERLAAISLSISGAETATLAGSEFTRTDNGDGSYTYQATHNGSSDGEYTATLDAAVDDAGNDGAGGQSAAVTVRDVDCGLGKYTDENGVVQVTGLQDAIYDWRQGCIEAALLRQVIDAWESGEVLT